MFKSVDQQHTKKGSPNKKHRRHAGLVAMDRKRQGEAKRRRAWLAAHRLDGMFNSVEEMMTHEINKGRSGQ